MTTTPNLPPLPNEDGYILITIAGRPVEVNAYRNSTMEAYALAAYQAGRAVATIDAVPVLAAAMALLVAGGFVTEEIVNEAIQIALHSQGEKPVLTNDGVETDTKEGV